MPSRIAAKGWESTARCFPTLFAPWDRMPCHAFFATGVKWRYCKLRWSNSNISPLLQFICDILSTSPCPFPCLVWRAEWGNGCSIAARFADKRAYLRW
ncbi:conserved hypothetical protein [Ricinus communis]|uniref:Uncharacterized protein n=1 Tax=Ricinus communis TaxID=3988 RepID=B9TF05_RICCO|nr:conserved hypothetical protein [Ricinus communis]